MYCAPLSASCSGGVSVQNGALLLIGNRPVTGAQAAPFQRLICTLNGGVPPNAMQISAVVPAWMLTSAGCWSTVGGTATATVRTAGALTATPAALYTITLYTAPLSATVSEGVV